MVELRSILAVARPQNLKAGAAHFSVVGEVVGAAALLQDAFFELFRCVLTLDRDTSIHTYALHHHALAIWHVIQSDSAQRTMAIEALASFPTRLPLRRAVQAAKWANQRANTLAEYRNILAHNPVVFGISAKGLIPNFYAEGSRRSHASKLRLINGLGFWRSVRDDFFSLSAYVGAVVRQMERLGEARRKHETPGVQMTWPRRPRLRSPPRHKALENLIRQFSSPTPKTKRRTRRKASPRK